MFPVPISDSSQMFTEHPCANFSFMPPPISPKRTGPRRKFSNYLVVIVYQYWVWWFQGLTIKVTSDFKDFDFCLNYEILADVS